MGRNYTKIVIVIILSFFLLLFYHNFQTFVISTSILGGKLPHHFCLVLTWTQPEIWMWERGNRADFQEMPLFLVQQAWKWALMSGRHFFPLPHFLTPQPPSSPVVAATDEQEPELWGRGPFLFIAGLWFQKTEVNPWCIFPLSSHWLASALELCWGVG